MKNKIVVHHVGGRNGSTSFPMSSILKNDFVVVLYEPDTDCLEHAKNNVAASDIVLPYCLGKNNNEIGYLNVNYDPYTSSLLKSNQKYSSYYNLGFADPGIYIDYVYGETRKTMEQLKIETITLDKILENDNVPSPDVLCLDTQGTEYEILEGASNALLNVVMIICEVSFTDIYENQKLFGDVSRLLTSKGFEFASFLNLSEASPCRVPISMRGKRMLMEGDACFFKPIEQLETDLSDDEFLLAATKLAFLTLKLGYIENAVKIISNQKIQNFIYSHNINVKYFDFLREFIKILNSEKQVYLPTFKERYSFEQSKNRFKIDASEEMPEENNTEAKIISCKKKKQKNFFLRPFLSRIKRSFLFSPMENLFINHGLYDTACLIKQNRKKFT
ncbi:MAG: hypothetical protein A3I77_03835 [Gammaproteobacteria bacterium RIFCSPLOWO2_02_FULL_42_14]|nr:MAG: hypothetical protein A3B71_05140 [Gammaproteobacteria bacterium RIFCSPHIGHO2_02_FULL_42_43]OGT28554.1 MAG: hypothetical protein A2624_04070 [Gammaproteobacteria bacterium RIFCSPHIGHO2_01_FULL_42_8]OGT51388.1 MAG: hypothetical protein A3E54_04905 [Gammaproteobacteria bacterium RIFCSPHIGHO2_12_FULL_41_25]OGT62090.1 MAG: hypothetical protein A3I77_03835 [Gammaproteobacteria bacterium RIFCSPLOWO2_02_FULL_42_14]OGT85762.1 MAG: hypothetical protein A3G86_03530 [Gammaproteobacteria bacterium R